MSASPDVTTLLTALRQGRREAMDELFPLVYEELRRIAAVQRRRQFGGSETLGTTALVHEAYLKLVGGQAEWQDRAHFYAVSARAMRQILVDHARAQGRAKRGGGRRPISLDETHLPVERQADELLALDAALARLEALDQRLGRVVEYRFFGGLSEEETAEVLGVTPRTVRRDWAKAKALLYAELSA